MSKNAQIAVTVATQMAQAISVQSYLSIDPTYAPARRDMLSASFPDDATKTLIYRSAIISRGFLDPEDTQTTELFNRLVDQVNAGLTGPEEAAVSGNSLLDAILKSVQK